MSEADKQDIHAALSVIEAKLMPGLVELSRGEARDLPVMGDKSYAFVIKSLEYAKQHPEFAAFIDVAEFEKDVKAVELLREFYAQLSQFTKKVHDTMTIAGSEAYSAGLAYYGSSKEGVKRKQPNAILIAEELGQRFPGRPKTKKEQSRLLHLK
jgi:hypothetical protein